MNLREDRWFVRFRGHTLGPLTTEQVKTSLRNRELSDGDKVASTTNPGWMAIGTHPAFGAFTQTLRAPAVTLAPIPPPQEIWQRKARNRAAEIATFSPEEPGAIPGINARGLGGTSSAPLYRNYSNDAAAPAARAYPAYPADPNARVIHPAAATAAPPTTADGKKKRVAAPGKKLGRPRKNPLPAAPAPAAAPVNKYDLSVVDLVAPILEAAPASVAAPIFDVAPKPAPSPQAPRPAAEPPAPSSAPVAAPSASSVGASALPSRPAFAAATDTHVPPPAVPVTLGAAIAAFEADEEPRRELSAEEKREAAEWEASSVSVSLPDQAENPGPIAAETPANLPAPPVVLAAPATEPPAILEEASPATVEASVVYPQAFAMAAEVAAIPEPRLEEIPAQPESNPAAEVEEVPVPAAPKLEAQPAAQAVAERAAPVGAEHLAVESLALLESLRDWRRKEEELAQEIRRGPVTPRERPVFPVREAAPVAPEFVREAATSEASARGRAAAGLAALLAHKYFLLVSTLVAVAVAAAVYVAVNKTRGPENRSFPDPSGPTQPASKEDPTPSLRAPTRPQRD